MVALALEGRSLRRDTVCNPESTPIQVPLSSLLSTGIKEKEGTPCRAMGSSNLYNQFATNMTETGALESVKL